MPLRTLIIAVLVAAALSGCGRRGNLELPSEAVVVDESEATAQVPDGTSPLDPGSVATETQVEPEPPPPPRRRFFLDFLL